MSKEEIEITVDSMFDSSKRRFLKLLGGGLVGVILAGSALALYRRLSADAEATTLLDNPQSGKVDSQNIVTMFPDKVQTMLSSGTNIAAELRFVLPFPFDPSRTGSTIEFVREYEREYGQLPAQPKENEPSNYLRFTGLGKGSVFNAPFAGEFAWSDTGNTSGVFLQQRVSEGRFVNLIVDSKEQIEILINVPPVPQNTPIFFSESKTHIQQVSIGQPLFKTLTEKNIKGPDYQVNIRASLFTLTGSLEDILPSGYYDKLDMYFLLTAENKYIVTK